MSQYLPVLIIFAIAVAFAGGFSLLSWLFGPKNPTQVKLSAYECGHNPIGSARERFAVKFYLVAMLFIIFDVEIAFMYPWAISFKEAVANGQGLFYFIELILFFAILGIGLLFAWRQGALDWARESK